MIASMIDQNHKYALFCPNCLAQSYKPASHVECWYCHNKEYGPQDLITKQEAVDIGIWQNRLKQYVVVEPKTPGRKPKGKKTGGRKKQVNKGDL
jgi:hypothetical protein